MNDLGKMKLKRLFFGKYIARIWFDAVLDKGHQKGTVKYVKHGKNARLP